MKKWSLVIAVCLIATLFVVIGTQQSAMANPPVTPPNKACWGQATMVYATMEPGILGEHSSQQVNPRFGLANLAVALYETGVLSEPSMQALGAFVADELGLSVDACME